MYYLKFIWKIFATILLQIIHHHLILQILVLNHLSSLYLLFVFLLIFLGILGHYSMKVSIRKVGSMTNIYLFCGKGERKSCFLEGEQV